MAKFVKITRHLTWTTLVDRDSYPNNIFPTEDSITDYEMLEAQVYDSVEDVNLEEADYATVVKFVDKEGD